MIPTEDGNTLIEEAAKITEAARRGRQQDLGTAWLFEHSRYLELGEWRCSGTKTGAHLWAINEQGLGTCKGCRGKQQFQTELAAPERRKVA